MRYRTMQQKMIDVLDHADHVCVKGKGRNHTDLTIKIHPLTDPEHQTAFENCVADVNIPVGEVFTSPVLAGTNGTLHVTKVFLNEFGYEHLTLTFTDGRITDYNCSNYASAEENKKLIHENLLKHHETLPMGEFAIGTNTTAYRMARDFDIADKLPILIAEKTGPHFAVGDTCYSHAEDTAVYNPDGKEIIARDNEVSLLRKEDPSKAYLNCHTDITIPYDELDSIVAVGADGTQYPIILDGSLCRTAQYRRNMIRQDTVNLLRHCLIETSQSGLHVDNRDMQFAGSQSSCQSGIRISIHQNIIRLVVNQNLLNVHKHLPGHGSMGMIPAVQLPSRF